MANPQPTDAHLRIAHSIEEQIMISDFSKRQRKILDLILRLSWGCGKKEAIIPQQKDFELVGVYECDIKEELNHLVNCKVISIEDNKYSFNKNYDQWRITISKKYTPERLCELLSLNLSELCKTQSQNSTDFAKDKVQTLQKTKFPTSEIALPKESIKEIYNNNNNYIDNNNKNITTVTDPEKTEITPDDICSLYEDEIGLLTPLMRKNIEESLDTFPADWVVDAIKTASEANVKKWSYIAKVLGNWARDGKPDLATPDDASKHTSGEFGKYVQTGPQEEELILGCYSVSMCLEVMNGQRDALPRIKDSIREELIKLNISFEEKPFIPVEERGYGHPPDTG